MRFLEAAWPSVQVKYVGSVMLGDWYIPRPARYRGEESISTSDDFLE